MWKLCLNLTLVKGSILSASVEKLWKIHQIDRDLVWFNPLSTLVFGNNRQVIHNIFHRV
ncbi:conserved protein of unknown function [Limnospira indica PCC 8005]|uniref:Uncharacterized protein n=1 Tax=Limnospira indica PCC 8005 TaxID=376219 RepID=A0A9P1P1K6_9CYAN|nr:conserved protein of unknown function [Limnospira indica PCC 8005]